MVSERVPLPAIVGPTAVGKTAVSLRVAEGLPAEIVNCDSRQVYRRMEIGTAKPTAEERSRVAHHCLDLVEPDRRFSAADYGRARPAGRGRVPGEGGMAPGGGRKRPIP